MVTVTDNDTAGLMLSATTLDVDEGGQNTYTVKLQTEPTTTVTVTVSSDDTGAATATVSGPTLIFTASNWDTEQTVTVAGVDDGDSANETVTVTNTASGGEYEGVTASVRVTVEDDDTPGVTVSPTSLTVGEGSTNTYDVKLNTAPTAVVTVTISSNNTDVTVSSSPLTFTTSDWSTEQTVTVSAGQDADAADEMATLTHDPSGADYGSVSNAILMVTVTDNDTAGLTLSTPTLGVDEAGQNSYTVKLDTQPTTTVTVTVSSDDTGAATVSGPTLIFTASNWDTARTVTVRGVNDTDSGDETVTITHMASGGEYAGVTETVTVTVDDDDTPGITFTPAARTIREGATGTYDVKLNTAPTADVTVAISSDNADVTLNKSSLTFTTANYATNQRVTVTAGQDADAADGTANLTHRPSGGDYSADEAKDFMVTVTDDDTAGLMLSATTLDVDEGGQNTYTVKLQTEPTTTVTVTVSSGDTGAATVSGPTLRFTTSNWNTAQTVTVEGVDDGDSANETVIVTNTASGGEYEGVTASVRVTVDDNDKPGITFTPASLTVGEGGGDKYNVKLNTAPTADVTVAISSDNPDVTVTPNSLTFTSSDWETEQTVDVTAAEDADAADDTANLRHRPSGGGYGSDQNKDLIVTVTDYDTARLELSATTLDVDEGGQNTYTVKLQTEPTTTVTVTVSSGDTGAATVDRSTLRFTTSNWETEQTVTVEGVHDGDLDGEFVTITNTASGGEYEGVTETVWLTVDDDDTRGITFTPAARTIREGATGTYDVKLNTAPTADVTVVISSDNADVTVNKSSLTFTTVNYATNQRVTVTAGQDPDFEDDTANLRHRPSGGDYSAGEANDFVVTVTDDDTAGLTVSPTSLTVDEAGQNTYTVALSRQPTADVTVTVAGYSGTDVTPDPTSLTFTTSNWSTAQEVTVTAAADTDLTNDTVELTHSATSTDSAYNGITIAGVTVTVVDNDTAQVTGVSVAAGNSQLVVNWTAVDNATGYKVQWKSGSENYNDPNRQATITSGSTTSHTIPNLTNGATYEVRVIATRTGANDGLPSAAVQGTPVVPTMPGVTVSKTALTVTEEDTTGASYTVVLDTQPTADVTVTVAGHASTDVTPSPATLPFTTSNWDMAQTVTVTAANDADATDDTVTLTHSVASTDTNYQGITIASVAVTVTDNDTAQVTGVSVAAGNGQLAVSWTAVDNATGYKVQWKSGSENYNDTTRQATITSTTSHTIPNLTNGATYEVRVIATRTGANDGLPSGEVQGTPVVPTMPGVTVSKTALTVTEEDTTGASYTVVLDTQPTADVTVTVAGHASTDVTPSPATLPFTTSNWDMAQTVTVTAANDADATDDTVTLTHSVASTDTNYEGITIASVAVTVTDNDTAQVTGVSVAAGNSQLVVNWTAVDNATGYKVQWKSGSENYNDPNRQATITSGSTTSHTIPNLTNGATYEVRVIATRTGANDGLPSAAVQGTPVVPTMPGVTVSKTALTVTEEDTTGASYTVVLDTQPTADVTVTVAGHASTDVTPSPATLPFTTSNWDMAQTVTVTAANDADATDDTVTLTHSVASTDTNYQGITIASVAVTVTDNDTAQVTGVSVAAGNGQLAVSWTAVDNATGYKVQWKSGSENYNDTTRQATITSTTSHTIPNLTNGATYEVRVIATRTGANDGLPSGEVQGTPVVPTMPGVTVSKTALTVTEEDTTGASYTVVLDTQPTADVTVTVAGHASTDVTPSPATLPFTTSNWDMAQTVTVTAANDADATDDTVTLTHSVASTDTNYEGITIASVAVTVTDNDTAQVTGVSVAAGNGQLAVSWTAVDNATGYKVQWKSGSENYNDTTRQATITSTTSHTIPNLTNGTVYEVRVIATRTGANDGLPSGEVQGTPVVPTMPGVTVSKTALTVTEEDTTGDSYTVVLDTQPTADVTVTVAGHASTDVTPSPATLPFTTSNWDMAQTVTVTAANDADATDDTVTLTHSVASTDTNYEGITIASVAVTVTDNDTAQVTGVSVAAGNGQLAVSWTAVDNATGYKVQWKSGSENYNDTTRQATITSTTSHTIPNLTNGATYEVRVIATRTGANDGLPSAAVQGTPVVPTMPGVTVSKTALTVTEEDTTGDSYTVVLYTQPTADVTVTVAGHASTDVTPSPATLPFTTSNWDMAQTVTVTAANDADATDDTVTLTHSVASTDTNYEGITIASVAVTVTDNDTAQVTGVSVAAGNGQLAVSWTAVDNATGYKVQWKSGSENYNDTTRQATITSTTSHTIPNLTNGATYEVRVIATRTGANDGLPSGEVQGTPAMPTTAGVTVSPTALTVTEEDTAGASYTVVLDTQPTADVTVTVAGHAGTDVTPSPATLTFTAQTWATAQTVTVTAGNDADTANDLVTLTHSAASTDNAYQGITIADVVVTVTDNDSPAPPTTGGGGGGGGGFGPALDAPQFVDGFRTSRPLEVDARAGDAVGDPVAATHPQNSDITYSLSGTDAARFTVDEETGQIRLGQALPLALGQSYAVNLTATDSSGTGAIIIVDIVVAEAPYHRYDLNKNGSIEKDEVLEAVSDYFADLIEKDEVLALVARYFAA